MSEMNISVLEAQVAAAGTTVFEIPVRQYPAVETRVFIDVRMVCRTVGMSVNNDFGSILSHGTGDVIDDDIHDFLAFFLVVIGALIAQASGQSDTVFKFFTEDLTLDIGAAQGRTELLIFRIQRAPHIAVGQKDMIKSDLNRNRICNELSTGGCGKTFTEQKVAVSVHHIDAVPVEEESFEGFQNVGIGRSMIVSGPEFKEVSKNDELGETSGVVFEELEKGLLSCRFVGS